MLLIPPALPGYPKVSVVVCAYIGERTIDPCLASLDKLNYPNYEVVVVNDGSTDGNRQIAENYDHIRLDQSGEYGAKRQLATSELARERRNHRLYGCRLHGRSGLAHLFGSAVSIIRLWRGGGPNFLLRTTPWSLPASPCRRARRPMSCWTMKLLNTYRAATWLFAGKLSK